jgi:hypothetical protein
MTRRRVWAIGIDGLDINLAEQLMAQGEMRALADLKNALHVFFSTSDPLGGQVSRGSTWPRGFIGSRTPLGANRV